MSVSASVLFAVADTGFWSIEQLRAWADQMITKARAPAVWLTELSMASTPIEASEVIRTALKERGVVLSEDVDELLMGLTYHRFRHGGIGREEFFSTVADIIDAYESSRLDVESWNSHDRTSTAIPTPLAHVLEDMRQRAHNAAQRLENLTDALADPFFLET